MAPPIDVDEQGRGGAGASERDAVASRPPCAAQQTVTGTGDLPEGPRGAELHPGDVGLRDGSQGVRGQQR